MATLHCGVGSAREGPTTARARLLICTGNTWSCRVNYHTSTAGTRAAAWALCLPASIAPQSSSCPDPNYHVKTARQVSLVFFFR